MSIADVVAEHRPWANKKSDTDEVVQCSCGRPMRSKDDESWMEWARHIKSIYNFEVF